MKADHISRCSLHKCVTYIDYYNTAFHRFPLSSTRSVENKNKKTMQLANILRET